MDKFELELTKENLEQTIKDDLVENNKKLFSLINLINSIDNNITICLDGDWGTGKTFLINQFKYLIDEDECSKFQIPESTLKSIKNIKDKNLIVYYDAWKNDNHIDPFESIIYNILNEFPKYKNVVPKYTIVKDVIGNSIKNFFEKSTYEIIDFDKITTYEDLAKQIVTMEEKKEKFKEMIDKILGDKRLIIIIDELDRCNPLYASKILETIKHFYDLKNITIIVVANNKELSNTIKKQYGYNFDAYSYLNKFYDFVITLDNKKNIQYAQRYLEFSSSTYLPHNIAYEMFKKYNFSYRDCNRYKTMYNMVKEYIEIDRSNVFNEKEYDLAFDVIVPIVIALKVKDIDAYRKIINGNESALKELLEYIVKEFESDEKIYGNWLSDITGKSDGEEIQYILKIYKKFLNNSMYGDIFNDCIRMTVSE